MAIRRSFVLLIALCLAGSCTGGARTPPADRAARSTPVGAAAGAVDGEPAPGPGGAASAAGGPGADATSARSASARGPDIVSPEESRVGITSDEIRICLHAPFLLGEVFGNRPEDEDVYWKLVNAIGGVHGRKVVVRYEDDAYDAKTAVTAAAACKKARSAFIVSGSGVDQIPAVREWAEVNRVPYLHATATSSGAAGKSFSFAVAPAIETAGRHIGQYVLSAHPGKRVAVLSRSSPAWRGARESFEAVFAQRGLRLATSRTIVDGQDYATEIAALRAACPAPDCVVFANDSVFNFIKLYRQSDLERYRPTWITYGSQLINGVVGQNPSATPTSAEPPVEAWHRFPAFDLYDETRQPWRGEIDSMLRAYSRYCRNPCRKRATDLNDGDWQFWLTWKQVHRLLLDCGRGCTRNALAGLLAGGYRTSESPMCELDFRRGDHHAGAWSANVSVAVRHSRWGSVWKQTRTCRESF